MEQLEKTFKALAEKTRLKIIAMLTWKNELCVCDFQYFLNISQSSASRHLSYLKNAGLLSDKRQEQWVRYKLNNELPEPIATILNTIQQHFRSIQYDQIRKRLNRYLSIKESSNCQLTPGGYPTWDSDSN